MRWMNLKRAGRWLLYLPLLMVFGCASFELTATPTADVYEDGKKVARTPYYFDLVTGQRVFTLKRAGYVDVVLSVSALDSRRQHVPMQWVGLTRVESVPARAIVSRMVNGKQEQLGITPCALRLSSPQTVRIEKKGFEPMEYDLTPNKRYTVELTPLRGFQSALYKDLWFVSSQGNVSIYDRVAGERLGITPAHLSVQVGSELEYRLEGFRPQTALISKAGSVLVRIELEPITIVTLNAPEGASVFRAGGGEPLGKVPYTTEIDCDTLFEVRKEGYYNASVVVAPGSADTIDVELKKIPRKTIVTIPSGAEVYRFGGHEKLGETPFTTVVEGERIFEIRKQGFKTELVGMGVESPEQLSLSLSRLPRGGPDAAALGELDSPVVGSH